MRYAYAILLIVFLLPFAVFAQKQCGEDIDGAAAGDLSGWAIALSADGSRMAVGAHANDGNGPSAGHVRVFVWQSGSWTQLGDDIDGEEAWDAFGSSVALSAAGNRLAIGAMHNEGGGAMAGHVRVYEWRNGPWTQLGDDIDGEAAGAMAGHSVSLSSNGRRLAIGAPGISENGSSAGQVRVLEWRNGSWTQLGNHIDGEAAFDNSGSSVTLSADGGRIAIGAPGNIQGSAAGHVRMYEWRNGFWTQLGNDIDGEATGEKSGCSIALSSDGGRLAVGAPEHSANDAGQVRVYEWRSSSWIQLGEDIDGISAGDNAGRSVALSGDGCRLVIGAPGNSRNGAGSGHVRIYEWRDGSWMQLGDDINGEAAYDRSGSSVALSMDGGRLAVGAPYNEGNGSASGHVRVYQLPVRTQDFIPVRLVGFNHDLVAEGNGGDAEAVTSTHFDMNNPGGNHVLYAHSFRSVQSDGISGLPDDGLIRSASSNGVNYQLVDYEGNNALLLVGGLTGSLTLEEPGVFDRIAILATSAEAASTFTLRVSYSDQTTEDVRFEVPYWCEGSGFAIKGFGRVKRTAAPLVYDDGIEEPRLYDILLDVDESRVMTHLRFIKDYSRGRAGIFAVCGLTRSGVPNAPIAFDADHVTPAGFNIRWKSCDRATAYHIDVATDREFTHPLPAYNNLRLGNVTTHTISAGDNTLYCRVRAANTVGQSVSSNTVTVHRGTTGVDPVSADTYALYPNPTRGVVWIAGDTRPIRRLLLTDALGRILLDRSDAPPTTRIDLSDFHPGMYFLSVHGTSGTMLKTIIKQ